MDSLDSLGRKIVRKRLRSANNVYCVEGDNWEQFNYYGVSEAVKDRERYYGGCLYSIETFNEANDRSNHFLNVIEI